MPESQRWLLLALNSEAKITPTQTFVCTFQRFFVFALNTKSDVDIIHVKHFGQNIKDACSLDKGLKHLSSTQVPYSMSQRLTYVGQAVNLRPWVLPRKWRIRYGIWGIFLIHFSLVWLWISHKGSCFYIPYSSLLKGKLFISLLEGNCLRVVNIKQRWLDSGLSVFCIRFLYKDIWYQDNCVYTCIWI